MPPTILPANYTKTTAPETFPSPSNNNVSWHTLISAPQTNTTDLSAGIATCPPQAGRLCPHRHEQAEIYYILDGEGDMTVDGVTTRVQAGCTVFIPRNAEHGIVNTGNGVLRWFYVFAVGSFGDIVYRFSEEAGQMDKL
jgi:mannose-6-phosphate isomerase-like protein (cupin superfamily)